MGIKGLQSFLESHNIAVQVDLSSILVPPGASRSGVGAA